MKLLEVKWEYPKPDSKQCDTSLFGFLVKEPIYVVELSQKEFDKAAKKFKFKGEKMIWKRT